MEETLLFGMLGVNNIEQQEAKGQKEFCQDSLMPKENNSYILKDDLLTQYKKLGIEIIGDYDRLFYKVKLPAGWKRIPTEHHMWNKLIDEQGRERGLIFYKAAFYDERAHFSLSYRFTISPNNSYYNHENENLNYKSDMDYWCEVKDGEKIVWSTPRIFSKYLNDNPLELQLKMQAKTWCQDHNIILDDPYANWDLILDKVN
jgi:hypothetical protein